MRTNVITRPSIASPSRDGFSSAMAPGARRAFFAFAMTAVCLLIAFPMLWLILTSLRPASGVYYVHRGLEFTFGNFVEVLQDERIVHAFVNSGLIATLATVLSLMVTVSSGYMLSRFRGPIAKTWFGTIYVFR